MDLQLADKTCLVTGAGAGIGLATAVALAREGAQVVVVAARTVGALAPALGLIKNAGGRTPITATGDLGRPGGAAALASQVLSAVGHVDILVNNAGASWPDPDGEQAWEAGLALSSWPRGNCPNSCFPA